MDRYLRVLARVNFMAVPSGYNDADWMNIFGGVPSDSQIDGYLANKTSASSNQKTLVTSAHKAGPVPHAMTLEHVKALLTNNS